MTQHGRRDERGVDDVVRALDAQLELLQSHPSRRIERWVAGLEICVHRVRKCCDYAARAMVWRMAELEAIRAGDVDLAFRRWERPRLLAGTQMRTAVGLVEVTSLATVMPEAISDADARRAGARDRDQLLRRLVKPPERPVYRIGLRYAGPDPRVALREQADLSDDERAALVARLDRFDRAATGGPWTRTTLRVIEAQPAVRAPDLAAQLRRETAAFKRDVRKLKELGLTESLEVGYRLSPRGRALLAQL